MLNHISWTNYSVSIITVLAAYYTIILVKYYRTELTNILSGRHPIYQRIRRSNKYLISIQETNTINNEQLNEDDLLYQVFQFKNEISHALDEAVKNNLIKQELIYSLQRLAKKYPRIKVSSYLISVNNYITAESSKHNSIQLGESDVHKVWAL